MSSIYNLLYDPVTGEVTYGTLGVQGLQGQGQQGFMGYQGFAEQGLQGLQGVTGFHGIQGLFGLQGQQGLEGFQGEFGYQGFQGIEIPGVQGVQGYQGSQGYQGYQGYDGIVGFVGRQGVTGVFPLEIAPIAIGTSAGYTGQNLTNVALGADSGETNQGAYAIAVGYQAGLLNQSANSIAISALGSAINPGTTGLFISPIRFTTDQPVPFGLQGLRGQQGFQGFQGSQGFQGFQGFQGETGATGIPGGVEGNIQYNVGLQFKGSNNITFNNTSNIFSFGAGNTGGEFNMIGGLVQGPVPGTVRTTDTIKLANFIDGQRYVEFGSDTPNASYVNFLSNDAGPGVDWDSIIISSGGQAGIDGQGTLIFDNPTSARYAGDLPFSFVNIEGRLLWNLGADRTSAITEMCVSGSIGTETKVIYSGTTGGLFNVMVGSPTGDFALKKFWLTKTGASTYGTYDVAATDSSTGVTISVSTTGGISISVTNSVSPSKTLYYTVYISSLNPFA